MWQLPGRLGYATDEVTRKASACRAFTRERRQWIDEGPEAGVVDGREFSQTAMGILLTVSLSFAAVSAFASEPPLLSSVPAGFSTIDIRPFCNMGWTDERAGDGKGGWSDQGDNDMQNAPLGLRDCR